jgi:CheY-like chemotaxis protein
MRIKQQIALVVDDNPEMREALRGDLEEMGFAFAEAADARAAIDLLLRHRPDLVCLDLVLPELSGYDLCEFIRRSPLLHDVPVLMMSARSLPEDLAIAEEAGASAYIAKPFSNEEFRVAVRALVGDGSSPPDPMERVA